MKRLTLLSLTALSLYLLWRTADPVDEGMPWLLSKARWDMECDYIAVKERLGQ